MELQRRVQRWQSSLEHKLPVIIPGTPCSDLSYTALAGRDSHQFDPSCAFPWLLFCWTLRTLGSTACPPLIDCYFIASIFFLGPIRSSHRFLVQLTVKDVIIVFDRSHDSYSVGFMSSRRSATTKCASWTDDAAHEEITSCSYRQGMGYLGEISSGRVRSEVWEYETRTTGNGNKPVRSLVSLTPRRKLTMPISLS